MQGRTITAENDRFIAWYLDDTLEYGVGAIVGGEHTNDEYQGMAEAALRSMVHVEESELAYSGCTDGRSRLPFADGSPAPVREKLVGADMMTAFHIAEDLGPAFYGTDDMPLADRILFVARFLKQKGFMPSTHGPVCGAAAGYTSIIEHDSGFVKVAPYCKRQSLLLPNYNEDVHRDSVRHHVELLRSGTYKDWSDKLVTDAVLEVTGEKGIKQLHDNHDENHGHNEALIARLKVSGVTIGATLFASMLGGNQVFTVNDLRLERLTNVLCEGIEDARLTDRARHAGEDFQDAGHATLAKDLPTLVIEEKTV